MSPNKSVSVVMRATQKVEGQREEQTTRYQGTLWEKGPHYHLIYEEENTKTHIRIEDKQVHIHRLGELSGDLWFAEGEERDCRYDTPYGCMVLTVHTHRILWDHRRMVLNLRYNLLVEGQLASMNEMTIEMKENKNEQPGQ